MTYDMLQLRTNVLRDSVREKQGVRAVCTRHTSSCSGVSFRLGGRRRVRLLLGSLLTLTLVASATTAAAALAAQCSFLEVNCRLLRFGLLV